METQKTLITKAIEKENKAEESTFWFRLYFEA